MQKFRPAEIVRTLLAAAFAIAASAGLAQDKPLKLFAPSAALEGQMIAAAPRPVRGAVRQRLVTVDVQALEKGIAPRGLDRAEDRVARSPRNTPPLSLELFPGKAATFRKQALEKAEGGGFVWTGEAAGESGAATLVVKDGTVTGHVDLDGSVFRVEPVGGATHRVIELNIRALPNEAPLLKPRAGSVAPRSSLPQAPMATTGITTIDLLVAYTSSAALASPNILADIDLAVALTNRAYSNSAVNVRIHLRGTILVAGYDETFKDYTSTLAELTGIDAYGSTLLGRTAFQPTRTLRDQLGADLVTLVRFSGSYCGQGWLIEKPDPLTSGYGFSQFSLDCIPIFVMAHELGHNMGLAHDRYVEKISGSAAPRSKYNFGFVNLNQRVRDIMSYTSRCDVAGVTCGLRNMFSNPRKLVKGARFGVFAGRRGAADASRRLNETRWGIAAYRNRIGVARSDPYVRPAASR